MLGVNAAVTVRSVLMVIVHGLPCPAPSSLQPMKADPESAVAVMLTVVPWA